MKKNIIIKTETGKESESLNTFTNATQQENNVSYGSMIDIEKIENTPFTIVKLPEAGEKNTFIAIGNNRLTEMDTYINSRAMIIERDWQLMMQMVVFVAAKIKEDKDINI